MTVGSSRRLWAPRAEEVARNFTRANRNKVAEVLETLDALSQVHRVGQERFAA